MITEQQDGTLRVAPEGEMNIYTAQQTRQLLLDALARGVALEADLSHVDEFDSAGLQLLLMARAEAQRAGIPFRFTGFSPAVADVLRLCQLNDWLDEPSVVASH